MSREKSDSGNTRIAGRRAHDDIPMAIFQAFRAIHPADRPEDEIHSTWNPSYKFTRTGMGTIVPVEASSAGAVPQPLVDRPASPYGSVTRRNLWKADAET